MLIKFLNQLYVQGQLEVCQLCADFSKECKHWHCQHCFSGKVVWKQFLLVHLKPLVVSLATLHITQYQ